MRRFLKLYLPALLVAAAISSSALALDIVVSNDDGFESALTHALYQRLKAAGHRVMISASTQDQSGQGSASSSFKPMTTLAKDSRAGSVKAGAPAFGSLPGDDDAHYVDGTPGMAVLYALDKLAPAQWHKRPDLVISGPNYGNNLGGAAVGSGTIAAALYAINRGTPAIAVSDGHSYRYRSYLQLTENDVDYEVADIVVRLVAQLERQSKKTHKPLLPSGTGLNVNVPAFDVGGGKSIRYRMTRLGHQAGLYYSDDLSQDPNIKAFDINLPPAPGFVWALKAAPPGLDLPTDNDSNTETVAIRNKVVTISVMRGMPQASTGDEHAVKRQLDNLIGTNK